MDNPKIEKLKKEWLFAKEQEVFFNKKRVDIENEILAELQVDVAKKGTIKLDDKFAITVDHNTKWEDEALDKFVSSPQNFPMELFPWYKQETWVLDKALLTALVKTQPIAYEQYIAPLLSVSPRKPSFVVRG